MCNWISTGMLIIHRAAVAVSPPSSTAIFTSIFDLVPSSHTFYLTTSALLAMRSFAHHLLFQKSQQFPCICQYPQVPLSVNSNKVSSKMTWYVDRYIGNKTTCVHLWGSWGKKASGYWSGLQPWWMCWRCGWRRIVEDTYQEMGWGRTQERSEMGKCSRSGCSQC